MRQGHGRCCKYAGARDYSAGAYGASASLYRNFIARGGELVFPKNTAMEITVGARPSAAAPKPPADPPLD